MTYLKVLWNHDFPLEPVELFSELDVERYEVRKVERFKNGRLQFADSERSTGDTWLGETPLPPAESIAQDADFIVCPLQAEEFEQLWQSAVISKAA